MMILYTLFKDIYAFLKKENLFRLFVILITMLTLGAVGVYLTEKEMTFYNAVWWSIVTMTTVGYGDITPVSFSGRIIGVLIMFFGIGLLGMFTASVASFMVERRIKNEKGRNAVKLEKHVIINEWNFKAKEILHELRSHFRSRNSPVVLIADIEEKPVNDDQLFFIRGELNEETLKKANLKEATTVILLGNDKMDEYSRDAKVVLSTLTIESINPKAYTIVELADSNNAKHCERANADEIIVSSEFSSKLISRAATDHGISKVLSELLSSRKGNNLFKIKVPDNMVENKFIDVFTSMKKEHNNIILGVQKGIDGKVISNPDSELIIHADDFLIVIANSNF